MYNFDQLKTVLESTDFWQQEDCESYDIAGGILVEMTAESGRCGWKVTWMDRTETKSDETFQSRQKAKENLHAYLTREKKALAYAASPPAKCELHPT